MTGCRATLGNHAGIGTRANSEGPVHSQHTGHAEADSITELPNQKWQGVLIGSTSFGLNRKERQYMFFCVERGSDATGCLLVFDHLCPILCVLFCKLRSGN